MLEAIVTGLPMLQNKEEEKCLENIIGEKTMQVKFRFFERKNKKDQNYESIGPLVSITDIILQSLPKEGEKISLFSGHSKPSAVSLADKMQKNTCYIVDKKEKVFNISKKNEMEMIIHIYITPFVDGLDA